MKNIIIVFAVCLTSGLATAQSLERNVVSNSGGFFKTSNMQLEYTVGELVVGEFQSSSIRLGQGYNQTNSDTSSAILNLSKANIMVYPNPGIETINIQSENDLSVMMYDFTGKLVLDNEFVAGGEIGEISVEHLSSGVYMIHLKDDLQSVSTLRWIKK